ncbi:MAG: hypothetical protein ACI4JK_05585 [Oscillospiraceae bacterium]
MRKILKWVCEHKDEPSFKYTAIIIVLIVLAIGVQIFDNIRTEWETKEAVESVVSENVPEEEDNEKENAVIEFLDNSKLHVFLLGVTGITLAYVEHRKKHKIKESR